MSNTILNCAVIGTPERIKETGEKGEALMSTGSGSLDVVVGQQRMDITANSTRVKENGERESVQGEKLPDIKNKEGIRAKRERQLAINNEQKSKEGTDR